MRKKIKKLPPQISPEKKQQAQPETPPFTFLEAVGKFMNTPKKKKRPP